MIAIINHGLGNFRSVYSAIESLNHKTVVTNDKSEIKNSEKIILPGVGNIKHAMNNLRSHKLIDTLNEEALVKNKPFLGICLGCQLLLESSEEDEKTKGLNWIKGISIGFKKNKNFPLTHVGWNEIKINDDPIFDKIPNNFMMYFNHSYFPVLKDKKLELGNTSFSKEFSSIFKKKNIYGMQAHPEKSQEYGIVLLKNFLNNVS